MKTSEEILNQIRNNAEVFLPDEIYAAALPEFAVFEIGQSRDSSQIAFFIYHDKIYHDETQNRVDLVYQLQLPGVSVLDTSRYSDIVFDWIKNYNFQNIGMTRFDFISIDIWPNTQDRSTIVFFDVSVIEELDSCD